jgi:hypothetical protein
MNMIPPEPAVLDCVFQSIAPANRQAIVVIASDSSATIRQLTRVCDFFDLGIEVVPSDGDLLGVLRHHRPMAVIADVDGVAQDGFHAMRVVASHDHDLPVMVLTHGDPVLMGAADAMQELWNLAMVTRTTDRPLASQLAEFLFAAGRSAGCMRLVRI